MTSKLKTIREDAGYTIEEIAEKLNIRKQYLIYLENEDFDQLPGKIYAEGYTKLYCEFLGIDPPQKSAANIPTPPKISQQERKTSNKQKRYIISISLLLLTIVVSSYYFLKSNHNIQRNFTNTEFIKNDNY